MVRRALPMSFFAAALPVQQEPPQPPSQIFDTIGEAFTQAQGQLLLLGEPGALAQSPRRTICKRVEG